MKRNRFGVNVDEGIALSTDEEFERLFVDSDIKAKTELDEWLNQGERPVLFGGQIGCGKTTWMNYVFHTSQTKPEIVFHFDRSNLNLSAVDGWAIVFTELFLYAASHDVFKSIDVPIELRHILGESPLDWKTSLGQIRLQTFSSIALEKNKAFNRYIEENQNRLPDMASSLINDLSDDVKKNLTLCASGVDKFEPGTAAYFSLKEILEWLRGYKTLFEVNAVHLFSQDSWVHGIKKIILTVSDQNTIIEMLTKRLGRYAGNFKSEIPLIAEFSGGIPRQALRLLDSLLAVIKNAQSNFEAFSQAVENINRDFFAYSLKPEPMLIKNIHSNRFLETSLISLPGDKETAGRAVFGNWILLKSPLSESRWEAAINPLIKESFTDVAPGEPERVLLHTYAAQTGSSDTGLEINTELTGWQETLISQIETPITLNVTEILDTIASSLLSKQRADRTIVSFENKQTARAVRAYLEAKSNSYEYQVWDHMVIGNDPSESPLIQILRHFHEKNVDVYSFEFVSGYSKTFLDELNIRRDSFIDKQMIWWIPQENLRKYLNQWTQLRQLFQVFQLEEDLTKCLSVQDIEKDIEFMKELVESQESAPNSYIENLFIVLEYLKGVTHG